MTDVDLFSLRGKKALVTGGAMGIGRGCAWALARAGAEVAIVDRDEAIGRKTATWLAELGHQAIYVPCDVRNSASVKNMVSEVVQRLGRLDIALNNAGIYLEGSDEEQAEEVWEEVIDINLTGTWRCARAEMRQMIQQTPTEGKIINVASIAATIACSNGSYDASKAGVVHLTKALAAQWGRYNINVNCISPSYILGGMGMKRSLQERQCIRDLTPLGHVQRVEDLYGPVVFLASKASDYVTGQNVIVDGGHTLSAWLAPLERSVPPRVDREGECAELKKELDARAIAHDDDGIIRE